MCVRERERGGGEMSYQHMEENDNNQGDRSFRATFDEMGSIIEDDHCIVGDSHHCQDDNNHDRADHFQASTKLEHIPCHSDPWLVYGTKHSTPIVMTPTQAAPPLQRSPRQIDGLSIHLKTLTKH